MWEALARMGGEGGGDDLMSMLGPDFAKFFSPEAYGQMMAPRGSSAGGDPMGMGENPFQGLGADFGAAMGAGGMGQGAGMGSLGDLFKGGSTGAGEASGSTLGGGRSPRLDRPQGPEGATHTTGLNIEESQGKTPMGHPSQGANPGMVNQDFIKQYLPPEFQNMTPEQLLKLINQQGQ